MLPATHSLTLTPQRHHRLHRQMTRNKQNVHYRVLQTGALPATHRDGAGPQTSQSQQHKLHPTRKKRLCRPEHFQPFIAIRLGPQNQCTKFTRPTIHSTGTRDFADRSTSSASSMDLLLEAIQIHGAEGTKPCQCCRTYVHRLNYQPSGINNLSDQATNHGH